MKNRYLYLNVTIVLVVGILFFFSSNNNEVRKYVPRDSKTSISMSSKGAMEYLSRIRAGVATGTIDIEDVERAQQQLKNMGGHKAGVKWTFRGPDNIGGRTRALLIDKDNSNIMYAGGVAGGLWKSTTSGQYWTRVSYDGATADDFANLAIVSICQTANGDIYFGTGEEFSGAYGNGGSGTIGAGIWKSSDNGESFGKLTSTWTTTDEKNAFISVTELAADPTNPNLVYAATKRGLRYTDDGGVTWKQSAMPDGSYEVRLVSDVKIGSNGTVIAQVGTECVVKKEGASAFESRTGQDVDESEGQDSLITRTGIGRMEFAFSPQDPDYIYCIISYPRPSDYLRNVYLSKNGGDTWTIIGKGGSALFQPLGNQGMWDICIAVNPANKNQVFIGGLDIWVGDAAVTGDLFSWSQVSLWMLNPISPLYVHADQHSIVFDPKDPQTLYISSDGGVSRGYLNKDNIKYQFTTMNKNYNVTQFYSIAMNSDGQIMGGTQDNGTLIITGEGNSPKNGFEVIGGDGGHVAMSQISPSIAYGTLYYGGLWRNNDANFADWNAFYTRDLADLQDWSSGEWEMEAQSGAFITPVAYWETDNDPYMSDTIEYISRRYYPADTTVIFPSHNVNRAPIEVTLDKAYMEGDTIYYEDPYSALFSVGLKRNVWLTRKGANWNVTLAERDWWRAIKRGTLGNDECVSEMVFSADGNHLFFATEYNDIYRLSNIAMARTYDQGDYKYGKNIITELTQIGGSSQAVTGLAVDPNNVDNLIVTLGNYKESAYVYLCTNVTTITSSTTMSKFTNITGNLPQAPAYCALFEMDENAGRVFVGTDMGLFKTENIFSNTENATWEPFQEGVGPVPVFQIKQQTNKKWAGSTYGKIYIGTHGLGFFENDEYYAPTSVPELAETNASADMMVKMFPNPVQNSAKVSIDLKWGGNVNCNVVNTMGQVVKTFDSGRLSAGENTVDLNLSELKEGAYILQLQTASEKGAIQFLKK